MIVFGTQLENTPLAREQSEIVSSFSHEYAWPKFEFSTVHSAMQKIDARSGRAVFPCFEAISALIGRMDTAPMPRTRRFTGKTNTALQPPRSWVLLFPRSTPRVRPDKAMLDDAWRNELTYDEHTWTYVSATTQPEHHQSEDQIALKGARAARARDDISESIQREWAQLEALVKTKDNSVAVFNSLNWPRSGIVETDLPEGTTLVDPSTGAEIPVEILWKGKGISLPGFGPGNVRVRFLATGVPAVGYKLYTIKPIGERVRLLRWKSEETSLRTSSIELR